MEKYGRVIISEEVETSYFFLTELVEMGHFVFLMFS